MTNRSSQSADDFPCPHCGEMVAGGASFCRGCGASEESGWNDDDFSDGYSADDDGDDFDYDDFVSREFPDHAPTWSPGQFKRSLVGIVIVLTCLAMLILAMGRF